MNYIRKSLGHVLRLMTGKEQSVDLIFNLDTVIPMWLQWDTTKPESGNRCFDAGSQVDSKLLSTENNKEVPAIRPYLKYLWTEEISCGQIPGLESAGALPARALCHYYSSGPLKQTKSDSKLDSKSVSARLRCFPSQPFSVVFILGVTEDVPLRNSTPQVPSRWIILTQIPFESSF